MADKGMEYNRRDLLKILAAIPLSVVVPAGPAVLQRYWQDGLHLTGFQLHPNATVATATVYGYRSDGILCWQSITIGLDEVVLYPSQDLADVLQDYLKQAVANISTYLSPECHCPKQCPYHGDGIG